MASTAYADPDMESPAVPPNNIKMVEDPPARVGRISYLSGTVSFKVANANNWSVAVLNRPLTQGDTLWTGQNSRAEIHIGTWVVRLAEQTLVHAIALDDKSIQFGLPQGLVHVHVHDISPNQITEIDTPNASVTFTKPGDYRAQAIPDSQQMLLTTYQGQAEVSVQGQAVIVTADKMILVNAKLTNGYSMLAPAATDDFDTWSNTRDQREAHPTALNYVSRGTVGYEDLDEHGQWQQTPNYGAVWVPTTVAVGWAPYRYGHWTYISPWGWTWIDDAPWGYAPFHYGRWVYWGNAWAWAPGPVIVRPVYAPALVAFVGGVGIGMAMGASVTWFPLGYHEAWVPGYGVSYGYIRSANVNVINVQNISQVNNTVYANRSVPGAVTAVPQSVFANSQAVGMNHIALSPAAAAQGSILTHGAPVAPQASSLMGAKPAASIPSAQTMALNHAVTAQHAPPAGSFVRNHPAVNRSMGASSPLHGNTMPYHANTVSPQNNFEQHSVPQTQQPIYHSNSVGHVGIPHPETNFRPSSGIHSYGGGGGHGFGGGRSFGGHGGRR